jgi:ribosomal protein S12 methylthiotransferase
MRYYAVSLGCPKNTVDTESMGCLLDAAGHEPVADPDQAELLLVNTCGFIASARAESIQVLRELAADKRPGQRLIAAGCLSQREGAALARQVKGLDGILGTRRWDEVLDLIAAIDASPRPKGRGPAAVLVGDSPGLGKAAPRVAQQGRSAYLQIADGCSAPCAFCAIPSIKGPLRSRPVDEILADARLLAERGVLEIVLVAQDTTAYGRDRGERDALPVLLESLVKAVPEVPWIRIMYAYPQHISARLIETMAARPQVVPYLDLPLQHAHPDTLRRMRRPANVDRVRALIARLRQAMPEIALRTAFIVGYPGETEAEFAALEAFLHQVEFDKVGVFTYSPELGTPAYDLPDAVPAEIAQNRYHRLMSAQQGISLARNVAQVGRRLSVLVEGRGEVEYEVEDGAEDAPLDAVRDAERPDALRADASHPAMISVGRSYRDAPEIDGLVLIEGPPDGGLAGALGDGPEPGQMVEVEVTAAMEYDLLAKLC